MRDSTIIYRSFYEAIIELPKDNQAEVWNAIFKYSLDFEEMELKGISKTIFTLIKPQLDANIERYHNGNKPKQKPLISKIEAKYKQNGSKVEANANENLNVNDNVNDNVNENKNYIQIGKEKFFCKTSDWLLKNKAEAMNEFLYQNHRDKNLSAILKQVDSETVGYEFEGYNHVFNFFKTTCKKVKSEPQKKIKTQRYFNTYQEYEVYCKKENLTPEPQEQ